MKKQTTGRLVRSPYLQIVEDGDFAVIWHSLFGNPQIVNLDVIRFMDRFARAHKPGDLSEEEFAVLTSMLKLSFINPEGLDERKLLAKANRRILKQVAVGQAVNYLELIMSEACNLACKYCIHFTNLGTSDRLDSGCKTMTFELAKKAVDCFLLALKARGQKIAEINFGGGEPLMVWPVIKQVLRYCIDEYGDYFVFKFSINTNATLLTREIADTLKHYQVSVASSLDGVRKANDSVRITRSGKGTFDQITRGFQVLKDADYPLEGFAVTITADNFSGLNTEIIDLALAKGMKDIRIDIDVVGTVNVPIHQIVSTLMGIRRYAVERGIDVSGFWSRPAENLNRSILKEHVAFCGAVRGNSICVSPTGNIYACGYSTSQIGDVHNFHDLFNTKSRYMSLVSDRVIGSMDMCRGCMIEGQCAGGCHITQEFARATGSTKIERMCALYQATTKALVLELLRDSTVSQQPEGGEK